MSDPAVTDDRQPVDVVTGAERAARVGRWTGAISAGTASAEPGERPGQEEQRAGEDQAKQQRAGIVPRPGPRR